jgi:hypothetical protein
MKLSLHSVLRYERNSGAKYRLSQTDRQLASFNVYSSKMPFGNLKRWVSCGRGLNAVWAPDAAHFDLA